MLEVYAFCVFLYCWVQFSELSSNGYSFLPSPRECPRAEIVYKQI